MKTNLLLFLFIAFVLFACNVGANKDLLSGLKMTNSGLSYEEAYIQEDTTRINTSEFEVSKTYILFITGVKGFTLKDNVIHLGGTLDVFDEKGNKLQIPGMPENTDLFAAYDETGVNPVDAEIIRFELKIGDPMFSGSKYTWKSKIWDKNGKGTINSEIEFDVK